MIVRAGAVIVAEGERHDAWYVVLSGLAQVRADGRDVGVLRAGDGFGEIATLHLGPRTAMVLAVEPVGVLRVPGEHLRNLLRGRPEAIGDLLA